MPELPFRLKSGQDYLVSFPKQNLSGYSLRQVVETSGIASDLDRGFEVHGPGFRGMKAVMFDFARGVFPGT